MSQVIYGVNPVRDAIQYPSRIQKVFIENRVSSPAAQKLKKEVMRSGVSYSFVPEQKLHKYTKENHQGFVALIGQVQFTELESVIDLEKKQLFFTTRRHNRCEKLRGHHPICSGIRCQRNCYRPNRRCTT